MSLSAHHKRLLLLTLPKLLINDDTTADLFYVHMFVKLPQSEAYFKATHMPEQKRLFMRTLSKAVNTVNNPVEFQALIGDLAKRHVHYGITVEDFAKAEELLIVALGHILKDDFTPNVEAAWRAFVREIYAAFVAAANIT